MGRRPLPPEAPLRRQLAAPLPDGPDALLRLLPPDETLEHLARILDQESRRIVRNLRAIAAVAALICATMIWTRNVEPLLAGGVTSLILLVFMVDPPRRVQDNALAAAAVLLPRAGAAAVPALLGIAAAIAAHRPDQAHLLFQIRGALAQLLPGFVDVARLTPLQVAFLRRECAADATADDLRAGALLVLADRRDREILPLARQWSREHPDPRVREAAAEVLHVLRRSA